MTTAVSVLKVLWYLACSGARQGCGVECHPALHVTAFPSSRSSQMSPLFFKKLVILLVS